MNNYLNELKGLIFGFSCENPMLNVEPISALKQIYASKDSIIYGDKNSNIYFGGLKLRGGVFKDNAYFSDDLSFKYELENSKLKITNVCENSSFYIDNFKNGDFDIRLSNNPSKEIAILFSSTAGMDEYLQALKDIDFIISKYVWQADSYAKIVLSDINYLNVNVYGSLYNASELKTALNNIKIGTSKEKPINMGIIKSLREFHKDNLLKKELYLISSGDSDDMKNYEKMLQTCKNINLNILANSKGSDEYIVKIHSFSIGESSEFMKELSKETGGKFFNPQNPQELKLALLGAISNGKSTLADLNIIHSAKVLPLYDGKKPDNNIF